MSRFLIYLFCHEASPHIYVGRSSSGLVRPRRHATPYNLKKNSHLPVVRWLQKYRHMGHGHDVIVLEECLSADDLNEAECFYIAYFKSIGLVLLNCSDGGEGLVNPSADVRAKIGAASAGRKFTSETKAKIAASNLGRVHGPVARMNMSKAQRGLKKHTPESKKKIGAAHLGVVPTSETRQKLSDAHRGKKRSPEAIANSAAGHRGLTHSPETRAKLSALKKGFKHTAEARAKISAAGVGRIFSDETKSKMSKSKLGKKLSPEHREKLVLAWKRRKAAREEE